MQYIGKIDKEKLGYFKDKILSDDVILTDEREEHLIDRHKEDCEKYIKYLSDVINEPDYILEDVKNKSTILMLKTIKEVDKNLQVVIKLQTQDENKSNSIITFWKMRTRSYNTILRNNKKIYENIDKKE